MHRTEHTKAAIPAMQWLFNDCAHVQFSIHLFRCRWLSTVPVLVSNTMFRLFLGSSVSKFKKILDVWRGFPNHPPGSEGQGPTDLHAPRLVVVCPIKRLGGLTCPIATERMQFWYPKGLSSTLSYLIIWMPKMGRGIIMCGILKFWSYAAVFLKRGSCWMQSYFDVISPFEYNLQHALPKQQQNEILARCR